MKQKKSLSTRRKRALRWVIALCLVVLANHFLGLYCITPGHALRQVERRYGLGTMEIWTTAETPLAEDAELRRWMLSCNDDSLLLSTFRFDARKGWTCQPVTLLRDSDESISVGQGGYCNETESGYETVYLFFGSVRDPDIKEVDIAARHSSLTETDNGPELVDFSWQRARVMATDFVTAGGRRVFLAVLDPVEDPGGSTYPEYQVQGVRTDGTVIPVEEVFSGLQW